MSRTWSQGNRLQNGSEPLRSAPKRPFPRPFQASAAGKRARGEVILCAIAGDERESRRLLDFFGKEEEALARLERQVQAGFRRGFEELLSGFQGCFHGF